MPSVYRISAADSCPKLTILDPSLGNPREWVLSGKVPEQLVQATIDRHPKEKEFCHLMPGTIVLPETAMVQQEAGISDIAYLLNWETNQFDLEADGRYFRCYIPNKTLQLDPKSGSPSLLDGTRAI